MNLETAVFPASNAGMFPQNVATKSRLSHFDREILLEAKSKVLRALSISIDFHIDDDVREFVTFSTLGEYCSSWAIARQDGNLLLWDAKSGVDIASFSSMVEVIREIAALTCSACSEQVSAPELTNIVLTSNVMFLTTEQLGRRTFAAASPNG
jgi:hypothetical protein